MKSKIISIGGQFQRNKQRPLSRLMIIALIEACEKQRKGHLFVPKDLKNSFTALIKRGLTTTKEIIIDEKADTSWQVTTEAIDILTAIGIEVSC